MSILIAVPCYTGVSDRTAIGLFNLGKYLQAQNIPHELLTVVNSSLISKCRSRIANIFVHATKFEYLLFLDSDIGFTVADFQKVAELGVDFATAPYSMKALPPSYNFAATTCNGRLVGNAAGNAVQVEHIGAGFNLIHRSVFERIARRFPELHFRPSPESSNRQFTEAELNHSFHYYETYIDPETRVAYSEDLAFCRRARLSGTDIWMRTDTQLTHVGNYTFKGTDLHQELGGLLR